MMTYKEIQAYVKQIHGYTPKTCWIADVKEQCGLSVRKAHNRQSKERMNPCPPNRIQSIKDALKHCRMI